MQKVVIIINGSGGSGKDTICNIVGQEYSVTNVSAIDPIKQMAEQFCGWKQDKTLKGRKLLSDLKQALIQYNDLPTTYITSQLDLFLSDSQKQFLFVHIREPEEIEKFKGIVISRGCICYTLLIIASKITIPFGNKSDDNVQDYTYDFIYKNDVPLEQLHDDFMTFFNTVIKNHS